MGEQFKEHSMFKVNGTHCTPFSFPGNMPFICPKNMTNKLIEPISYKDNLMYTIMEECMGQKPCITEEYSIFENKQWSAKDPPVAKKILEDYIFNRTLLDEILDNQMDKYMILLEFAKGKWSNGLYANKIQKHIYREYLAWTGTSLVGNIGGQLGLWVGFSVAGFISGAMNYHFGILTFVRKKMSS